MDIKSFKWMHLLPTASYFILCTFILLFDFNIYIEGSTEYPQFYIMPILYSIIFLIVLIIILKYVKTKKELNQIGSEVQYNSTVYLFIIYMAVIWVPRQFMMWRFGITYEKLPILYLIVTQIVLVEGLMLTEFGLHRKNLLKNLLLGCFIALINISIMTVFNILIPVILNGTGVLLNLEIFEISQFITFPWQLLAVGISEELFFRGYFFTKLRKSGARFWHSAILTSFVFMIFHVPWLIRPDFSVNLYLPYIIWRVINTFPFGLVCCALYEKTGSLTASIVYHGFSNSLTTFLVVNIAPTFTFELIIWIITFGNLVFLVFLTPYLTKLFGFGKNNKLS